MRTPPAWVLTLAGLAVLAVAVFVFEGLSLRDLCAGAVGGLLIAWRGILGGLAMGRIEIRGASSSNTPEG